MRFMLDGAPQHVLPSVVLVDTTKMVRWQMTSAPQLGSLRTQRRACARHLAYAGRSRATNAPPAGAGRNFWEVLRVLDSLQLTTLYDVGTPAHWKAPEDCYVLPHVADEAAAHVSPGVRHVPAANLSLTRSPSPGVCPPRCSLEA